MGKTTNKKSVPNSEQENTDATINAVVNNEMTDATKTVDFENESTNMTEVKTSPVKTADLSEDVLKKAEEVKATLRKNELISEAKRIQKSIEIAQEKIEREKQKTNEWIKQGNALLQKNNERFNEDKVKKLLDFKEEGSIEAKDVLINFYKTEIERLQKAKQEQEENNEPGELSKDFQKYLKKRIERYETRKFNVTKNWIKYSEKYLESKLPPIYDKISKQSAELEKIQAELENKAIQED